MTPTLQAHLAQQSFAVGERIPVILVVSNPGPEVISVIDPRRGGNYFRLRLQLAAGEWRVVNVAQVLSAPGDVTTVTQVQVPVRDQWTFEFDLTTLTRLDEPGNYSLVVDYEWEPEQAWRSPPLSFELVRLKDGGLAVTPSEATRSGYHSLVWWGVDGGDARAFLLNFRIQKPDVAIQGALEIARLQPDSVFTLSMSPASSPFPDRWVVWVNGDRVHYSYWARASEDRLPTALLPMTGFPPELIQPVLARAAPYEGRPGCLIGLLLRSTSGSQLVPVEIAPDGRSRFGMSHVLNGVVRGAWGTSPNDRQRLFVVAVQNGPGLRILAVECGTAGDCLPPVSWFATDGEFLAGDIRVALDHSVQVGLLINRADKWERVTFTAPNRGPEPKLSVSLLEHGPQATAVRIRLDAEGDIHTLFLRDEGLRYAGPFASAESWSHRRPAIAGNSADLLISPEGQAVLVYYDFEKGPTFLRL